jgi:hypothetical protein
MKSKPSLRTPGVSVAERRGAPPAATLRSAPAAPTLRVAIAALALAACNYSFTAGGGFPSDIRTLYIESFDNQTVQLDLAGQLFRTMNERVPRSLGVRPAGEAVADAIIRGRVVRYDDVAMTRPGAPGTIEVLQHQVQVTVAIQIIDVRRNEILWESSSLSGRGEYRPDTQTDDAARQIAIESIVRQIIDGAQSQW